MSQYKKIKIKPDDVEATTKTEQAQVIIVWDGIF